MQLSVVHDGADFPNVFVAHVAAKAAANHLLPVNPRGELSEQQNHAHGGDNSSSAATGYSGQMVVPWVYCLCSLYKMR